MPDVLLDIVGVLPVQTLFAYALTKMLDIRRPVLYWVLEMAFVLFIAGTRSITSVEFRLVAAIAPALVPIVLSEGGLARRILIVALAHFVLFFADLPGGALWITVTGTPVGDYNAVRANLGAFAVTHALHFVLVALLLTVLYRLVRRFPPKRHEREKSARLPALFSVIQLVLASIMIILPMGYIENSLRYYAVGVALSLMGFAADALLFAAMSRYTQKRRDDERATLLEEQLDGYLAQCGELVEDIERTLKMRHDVGNQVQVVLALSNRGRFHEAYEHLGRVSEMLAGSSAGEEVVRS
ncbi:hypothetical protein [Arabiibacter massiliensis]|uniref:hypothetical protein n=1 Tax=Arabiibacter massiliensis TaxID=1870985 RepID=UPI0009BB3819|nr:hypothetical protein [Arabiibacter massiliensis]